MTRQDLTDDQQQNVRTAILYLRWRTGSWKPVAKALRYQYDTVEKVANERGRPVTPTMAFRVANALGVTFDDLISGRILPHACPNCGYVQAESDGTSSGIDLPWHLAARVIPLPHR